MGGDFLDRIVLDKKYEFSRNLLYHTKKDRGYSLMDDKI